MNSTPAIATLLANARGITASEPFVYRGMRDASAAAALGADRFVVANDERNQLKIYCRGEATALGEVDLSVFLGTKVDKESDLEGAATIGDRIYWISSHGRNKKGEFQERRHRFFATELRHGQLVPSGAFYARLLDDMIAAPQLRPYRLDLAAGKMPEEPGAFNIEGLAATAQGGLLIGLRNPSALLIPLLNPAEVIQGNAARFGQAIALDLGGLGIRSIELVDDQYLIIAGPRADQGQFALYQWSGDAGQSPVRLSQQVFAGIKPEALFAIPGTRTVQILSDDGGPKKIKPDEQGFQSVCMTL